MHYVGSYFQGGRPRGLLAPLLGCRLRLGLAALGRLLVGGAVLAGDAGEGRAHVRLLLRLGFCRRLAIEGAPQLQGGRVQLGEAHRLGRPPPWPPEVRHARNLQLRAEAHSIHRVWRQVHARRLGAHLGIQAVRVQELGRQAAGAEAVRPSQQGRQAPLRRGHRRARVRPVSDARERRAGRAQRREARHEARERGHLLGERRTPQRRAPRRLRARRRGGVTTTHHSEVRC
mmetsp:Transcript_8765/g.33058  ORF Transcript_8765/g.33058 Transcript_8765/m.33058 type:complete len:230 (+) Transcript_8765:2311-3000(+)